MPKFQGGSCNSVDDKGRIVIPQRFRLMLGERFIMTRGFEGCVFIFTLDQWQRLGDKFGMDVMFDKGKVRLQRFLFGAANEVAPDGQGRVAIPQELREWAKIEPNSEVVITGCTNWVEIWAKQKYDEMMMRELELGEELMDIAKEMGI